MLENSRTVTKNPRAPFYVFQDFVLVEKQKPVAPLSALHALG